MAGCNPELASLITETIGNRWVTDLAQLKKLEPYAEDAQFRQRWREIKQAAKQRLIDYKKQQHNIDLNVDAIFDVQVKRIHEYKRQLLNVLHVIYLYNRIKKGDTENWVARCVLIGGKAAPGYRMAKKTIKPATKAKKATGAKATTKKVKTTAKLKTAKGRQKKATSKAKTVRGKPAAKKPTEAKTTKTSLKKSKPPVSELAELQSNLKQFGTIKVLLEKLSEENLNGLWLGIYGYGDETTEADLPDIQTVIEQLADRALELQPTPEEMTTKGLADLIDDAS